jgi:hypothetical protein
MSPVGVANSGAFSLNDVGDMMLTALNPEFHVLDFMIRLPGLGQIL